MQSLIVYSSQSGNTKKLAHAVYESLTGPKEMYAVVEAPDPANYDFIALGFWLQAGKPESISAEYLGKVGKKTVVPFCHPWRGGRLGSRPQGHGPRQVPGSRSRHPWDIQLSG